MWSKLKQRLENRFADGLKGRLHIYETRQRMGHNHNLGEIWLTLNKERIFSTSDMKGWQRMLDMFDGGDSYTEAFEKTAAEGTLPIYQSNELLFASLSMTIEEMLSSHAVILRGLGVADARCGRRRLEKFKPNVEAEHEFIQRLYRERLTGGRTSLSKESNVREAID